MPHKLKLLIIEDEAPIREGLIDLFVYHGYDADGAADGEQGLQMALTGGYAMIVLDIMLPRLERESGRDTQFRQRNRPAADDSSGFILRLLLQAGLA